MTVASKLTKSVRQAKASAAKQNEPTGADAPDPSSPQGNELASNSAQETKQPDAGKKPESESPVVSFVSRRVWPD